MFDEVLVGVDGQPNGRDAVALARQLVDPAGRLVLVHVHAGDVVAGRAANLEFDAVLRDDSRQLLERERAEAGIEAELVSVSSASVGRGLHRVAEERGADLLVVGSSSRGPAGRVLLGDDASASLNGAPCAVAIAPRGYSSQAGPIARVGVGYDGSPESETALLAARALAARHGAQVSALAVVGRPMLAYGQPMPVNWGDVLDELLDTERRRVEALEDVSGRAAYGLPGEELAAFGDEVDVLVVGSRNYGPMGRLMHGSTAHYLARHARCPLLVLPRGARKAATGAGAGS